MKNHDMMNYGFVEATEFEGLMPAAAEKLGTVGASDVIVKRHGVEAKGIDALEVVDVEGVLTGEQAATDEPVEEPTDEPVKE